MQILKNRCWKVGSLFNEVPSGRRSDQFMTGSSAKQGARAAEAIGMASVVGMG